MGFHRAGLFLWGKAQIARSCEAGPIGSGRPPEVTTTELPDISGNPNISEKSNTYVERQNLTIKISMRRFKRLVNALSKKADKLKSAVVL